jgi:hypothetical protein
LVAVALLPLRAGVRVSEAMMCGVLLLCEW